MATSSENGLPRSLRWTCLSGIPIAGVCLAVAALSAAPENPWKKPQGNAISLVKKAKPAGETQPSFLAPGEWCEAQRHSWESGLESLGQSQDRLSKLEKALTDPDHPAFSTARDVLKQELEIREWLKRSLTIGAVEDGLAGRVLMFALGFAVAFLLSTWLRRQRKSVSRPDPVLSWKTPLLVFCASQFAGVVIMVANTSVWTIDKRAINWDSYCISQSSFAFTTLATLGLILAFSEPWTLAWCFSRRESVPDIRLEDKDGKCGVGAYVLFLQKCTMMATVVTGLLTATWVRYARSFQTSFDSRYLIVVGTAVGAIVWIVARMIGNALLLRERYEKKLLEKRSSSGSAEEVKIAPDPTADFLGEGGLWKLGVTLAAVLGGVWTLLEWTGTSQVFLDVVH